MVGSVSRNPQLTRRELKKTNFFRFPKFNRAGEGVCAYTHADKEELYYPDPLRPPLFFSFVEKGVRAKFGGRDASFAVELIGPILRALKFRGSEAKVLCCVKENLAPADRVCINSENCVSTLAPPSSLHKVLFNALNTLLIHENQSAESTCTEIFIIGIFLLSSGHFQCSKMCGFLCVTD